MRRPKKDIKEHWNKIAKQAAKFHHNEFPLKYCGTHKDYCLQHLENDALLKYINNGDRIIDIGCGKGYSTLYLAWKKKISALGIDYSEEMIAAAQENRRILRSKLKSDVKFTSADIFNLQIREKFDTAITQRCLINIPSWKEQKKAIANISGIIKSGGLLLLLEGSKQGIKTINQIRTQYGLAEITVAWYNLFFDDRLLESYASKFFKLIQIDNFCSTYMLVSRILHPAIVFPEEPKYDAVINEMAAKLPNSGDFGYDKLYVFRRR